jgi:ABC-type branched-subunit amino acid transport system substrate-binding protein
MPVRRVGRLAALCLAICALGLSGCFQVTRPVVKIGLVAPFEGRYRDVGYEVIYAVRLAVREANAAGGVAGYSIELLALDDSGDPAMAVTQAQKIAIDTQVVGVIGDWLDQTTTAAAPAYAAAGLPLLATTAAPTLDASAFRLWPRAQTLQAQMPQVATPTEGPLSWGQTPFFAVDDQGVRLLAPAPMPDDSADPAFAARFRAIANGVEPNAYSVLAYDAARLLLDALARDVAMAHGAPTRAGEAAALRQSDYHGLSGPIQFDAQRNWLEARSWLYRSQDGQIVRP